MRYMGSVSTVCWNRPLVTMLPLVMSLRPSTRPLSELPISFGSWTFNVINWMAPPLSLAPNKAQSRIKPRHPLWFPAAQSDSQLITSTETQAAYTMYTVKWDLNIMYLKHTIWMSLIPLRLFFVYYLFEHVLSWYVFCLCKIQELHSLPLIF